MPGTYRPYRLAGLVAASLSLPWLGCESDAPGDRGSELGMGTSQPRNDLASVDREAAGGNHDNYVIVLAEALGIGIEKAAVLVEQQITDRVRELLDCERTLRRQAEALPSSQASAFADTAHTLRTMTAAHARWIVESGRYPHVIPAG